MVPFFPFDAPTARDIIRGDLVATVAYVVIDAGDLVGIDGGYEMGVIFNIQ